MKTNYSLDTGGIRARRKPAEISMTPMIDVIFLLLVFFLATSSFQLVEKYLPSGVSELKDSPGESDLPPPEVTPEVLEQIIVKIHSRPEGSIIVFNGTPLRAFEDLRSRFEAVAMVRANVPVIIDPDPAIPASQVVRAYDWARRAGMPQVYLAARQR